MRKEARINESKIVYDDIGSGEVILFIHGQPFNRSMWRYQVDFFKERFRLIIPDLRGYGESDVPMGTTLLDELARDLAHLLGELAIEKAVIVGVSMGGQIVLELYKMAPHLFSGMVLCGTDAKAESVQGYASRMALVKRIIEEGMVKLAADTIQQYVHRSTIEKPAVIAHLKTMMETTPAMGAAYVQKGRAERQDLSGIVNRIACPVQFMVGRDDQFTPVSMMAAMKASVADAELVIIDEAGHLPNMEQPAEFNRSLAKLPSKNQEMKTETTVWEAFHQTTQELTGLLDALNQENLNRKPKAGGWSPGQVGDHLLKSYASVYVMTGQTEPTSRQPDEKVAAVKALFLDFGIRMESPEAILPSAAPLDKTELLTQLRQRIGQLLSVIGTADLSETCLDFAIPEYGPFTRLEWAWFNTYHTQRHVYQLTKILHEK